MARPTSRNFAAALLLATAAIAQEVKLPDEPEVSFGVTTVSSAGLKGDIYLLKRGTDYLPNFKKLKPIGSVYTPALNMPTRDFKEGFPGVTDRYEWFAIDYQGRFWIAKPGKYNFALAADDGAKLYIDGKNIIDNDGLHSTKVLTNDVKLAEGVHKIRVSYFQGPGSSLALILAVSRPGETTWRIFHTHDYKPPAGKFDDGSVEASASEAGKKTKKRK